jgi:ComF family protein
MVDAVSDRARSVARFFATDLPLGLKNLFLPAFCRKCGVRILTEENLHFCGDCWSTIELVEDPKCPSCGRPHSVRVGFDAIYNFVCSECAARKLWVTNTYAAGIHADTLRDAIHLLKFGRKRHVARPLGRLLIERVAPGMDTGSYDLLTAVPLHRNRLRERGFNQSELIAEQVSDAFPGADLKMTLMRVKDTPNFSMLGAKERGRFVKRAFRKLPGVDVKKKRVLLVDDVVTTGATTNECARVLRRAGAKRVDVLAVAVAKRLQ